MLGYGGAAKARGEGEVFWRISEGGGSDGEMLEREVVGERGGGGRGSWESGGDK